MFVDTNVLIDILVRDPVWFDWSMEQLAEALNTGQVMVSAVVAAELSRDYPTGDALAEKLDRLSIVILPLDLDAAFLAGKAFANYRGQRSRDRQTRVLPDFFIGAQAVAENMPLLTRDGAIYRRYLPDLILITPENHP